MSIDTVGNFLTIIRNAVLVYKRTVSAPYSRMNAEIARVLKDEGFIRDFARQEVSEGKFNLVVYLKYVEGESVIHEIKRISTPGCRFYKGIERIKPLLGGLGLAILTTNKGVISDRDARIKRVGGEVLCHVW